MEKRQELEHSLESMGNVGDVLGSAIIRRDGLIIASQIPQSANPQTVAAMTAAIVGTSETGARELGIGKFDHVIVSASEGQYISMGAGEAILIVLLKRDANLGLALVEMEKEAKKISEMI